MFVSEFEYSNLNPTRNIKTNMMSVLSVRIRFVFILVVLLYGVLRASLRQTQQTDAAIAAASVSENSHCKSHGRTDQYCACEFWTGKAVKREEPYTLSPRISRSLTRCLLRIGTLQGDLRRQGMGVGRSIFLPEDKRGWRSFWRASEGSDIVTNHKCAGPAAAADSFL